MTKLRMELVNLVIFILKAHFSNYHIILSLSRLVASAIDSQGLPSLLMML